MSYSKQACKTTLFFSPTVTFGEHGQLKGWQPHHPPWIKAQSPKPFIVLQWSHGTIGDRNIPQQVLETTTPWPNPLLLCIQLVFSPAGTKGWAWCNHNAAALADLKLLVGSGLIFHKRHGIRRQACRKNLLSAVSRFASIGSWKAGSHTSNPLLLKAQSRLIAIAWQMGKNTFQYSVTNLGDHNSVTKPMPLYMRHKSRILDKGVGSLASITQAKCRVFFIEENRFRQYTWMLQRQDSVICLFFQFLNKHVQQISFRQRIRFCQHRQLKGWQPHFQPTVAKSSIYDYDHALHTSRELQARLRKILNLRLKPSGGLDFQKHGFLRQTCRVNLFSAVRHILGT